MTKKAKIVKAKMHKIMMKKKRKAKVTKRKRKGKRKGGILRKATIRV